MSKNLNLFRIALTMLLLVFVAALHAQTVKGVVKDSSGEPIIGASILELGTQNGTTTDLEGAFTLKVQSTNHELQFSYIGMKTQTVKIGATREFKIVLEDDSKTFEEIVVVGYTSRARKDLTGSVGSVSGAKLAEVPVASAAEALQGKIAGVQVTTDDGAPGAEVNIRIRGGSSLSSDSSKPLFIVDGFPQDNINDIPPTDIQSMDILKDASLTAIYGARGGNGVVIVTTKSAKSGSVKVDFNTYWSWSKLAGKQEMLNTYEFVKYQLDYCIANNGRTYQFRRDYGNPNDLDIYKNCVTHDWQDEVLGGTPLTQNYNVTLTGGNDKIRFNTSLSHNDQEGLVDNTGVRRTNMNTKLNITVSPKVQILINPRFTYRRDLGAGSSNIGTNGLVGVLRYRPTNGLREYASPAEQMLSYDEEKYWAMSSPKDDIDQNYQLKHTYTFTNQASITWNILEGLTFKSDFGLSWMFRDTNRFYGALTSKGIANNDMPFAEITKYNKMDYTWTNTLNYGITLNKSHDLSFLLGQEIQHSENETHYSASRYFPQTISPRDAFNNMGLGSAYQITSSRSTPIRTASFFGQAAYNYKHKYLISATFRADGSSRFAPGQQWGYFPSASAGWVVSEEGFWGENNLVNMFKVRVAIGTSGDNNIGEDRWRYVYSVNANGGPSWGENTVSKLGEVYYAAENLFPNTDIKWQTKVSRNLAFDIQLFKGRLTITPEVYWDTTHDLLYKCEIPTTTGYATQYQNIGQVTNRGFEISVSGDILRGKDYFLTGSFNLGMNKTRVDKVNGVNNYFEASSWDEENNFRMVVGQELGLIYGYVYDGIYQFDEFNRNGFNYEPKEGTVEGLFGTLPGRIKFKDLDNSGSIDINDRTVIGNTNPRYQGGFSLNGQYKNFDFNANFVYMLDFDILNATAYELSSAKGASQKKPYNVLAKFNYDNRWVYYGDIYTQNTDGTQSIYNLNEPLLSNSQHIDYLDVYEQLNSGKTLWNPQDVTTRYTHSYFVEDGSFLRLQNVTVGYTLPSELTKKVGISKLRAYVTGSNLFCITSYSGYDPEVNIQKGLTPSVDYNTYPRSRSYLFGLNMTF